MLSLMPNLILNLSLILLLLPNHHLHLLPNHLLPNTLIGMAFLIPLALIVYLMHLQTITLIVSLKGLLKLILAGYIQRLKSRKKIQLGGDIYGAVIAIFENGIKGG